ncbi:MAG TPA: FeoB-associated Cys-rich membrane protein [Myxococcales bacterium]|jgi:hypothetical protein
METLIVIAVVAAAVAWAAVRLARKFAAPSPSSGAPSCSGCTGCSASPSAQPTAKTCPALSHSLVALRVPRPSSPGRPPSP